MKNKLYELRINNDLEIEELCFQIEKDYSIHIDPEKVKLWEGNEAIIPNFYIHIFSNYFNVNPDEFGK